MGKIDTHKPEALFVDSQDTVGRIVENMPHEEYIAHKAVSRSGLTELLRSPQHYWWKYLSGQAEREDTTALRLGTAFHTLLLQPSLFSEVAMVWSGKPRNTKEGKDEYAAAEAQSNGKLLIKQADFEHLQAMARSILAQPAAKKIIDASGKIEASFFYTDMNTGVEAKARPDFWREDGIVVDLKTTNDASEAQFQRSIVDYGYDIQAFMQMEAIERVTGTRPQSFVFICVEKDPPYAVAFYTASPDLLRCGEYRYHNLMSKYAQCMKSGQWPGYGSLIRPISVPDWFVKRLDNEAAQGVLAK